MCAARMQASSERRASNGRGWGPVRCYTVKCAGFSCWASHVLPPHGLLSELPHSSDTTGPWGTGDWLWAGQRGGGAACEGCGEEAFSGGLCFLDGSRDAAGRALWPEGMAVLISSLFIIRSPEKEWGMSAGDMFQQQKSLSLPPSLGNVALLSGPLFNNVLHSNLDVACVALLS